jgi:hypothetical protein
LLTPPWPLHAPRPLCAEVVPSLQVTPPLAAEEDDDEDGAVVPDELLEELLAGAELPELAAAVADLSTPPWPLQAPRPACVAVLPSLQTGSAVLVVCDRATAGASDSATTSAAPQVRGNFTFFICSSPERSTAYYGISEYRKLIDGGIGAYP